MYINDPCVTPLHYLHSSGVCAHLSISFCLPVATGRKYAAHSFHEKTMRPTPATSINKCCVLYAHTGTRACINSCCIIDSAIGGKEGLG